MTIRFVCPDCGQAYQAPETAAGKRRSCLKCGAAIRVPLAENQSCESPPATEPAVLPSPKKFLAPLSRIKLPEGRKRHIAIGVFAVIVCAAVYLYFGYLQKSRNFQRGTDALAAKDYDLAISCFTDLIRSDSSNGKAYEKRGLAYFKKEQLSKAIEDYTEAIRIDPKLSTAYSGRAAVFVFKDSSGKAILDCDRAIQIDPNNATAYLVRARARFLTEKVEWGEIQNDFAEAIRLDPSNHQAYLLRGLAFYDRGNHEKAISDFTAVLSLSPDDAEAYYWRGVNLWKSGKKASGRADIRKAATLDKQFKHGLELYD